MLDLLEYGTVSINDLPEYRDVAALATVVTAVVLPAAS